ncbi:MAG: cytidylyltransferase domain-containing protein, partial [Lachnospiraceae bacterium]
MKILAVIPARAGSKGIPNKNFRIVNGKPLIAYCIENALKSEFITDILVSTDSPEIELLANFYGIQCLRRRKELCGDEVTLDTVVYDACKDYYGDYVITMQPTSPTLKYTTLDQAIELAMQNQSDTLISVVNKPHLAWIENNGKLVPDYEERVNRQYMPKRYLETGAFVISKREVVTENTRIGKSVSVYEISEREAVDIDNFQDLLVAEAILKERKTAIIVDGNDQIGMGHIYRALELADILSYKPDIYFNRMITEVKSFGDTTYPLIPYSKEEELLEQLNSNGYQLVINDILDTDEGYVN